MVPPGQELERTNSPHMEECLVGTRALNAHTMPCNYFFHHYTTIDDYHDIFKKKERNREEIYKEIQTLSTSKHSNLIVIH